MSFYIFIIIAFVLGWAGAILYTKNKNEKIHGELFMEDFDCENPQLYLKLGVDWNHLKRLRHVRLLVCKVKERDSR